MQGRAVDQRDVARSTGKPIRSRNRALSLLGGLVVVAISLVIGVGFAAFGNATTPLAMLAFPILTIWLAMVLARPAWAIAAFFVVMPFSLQRVSAGSFQIIEAVTIAVVGAVVLARLTKPAQVRLPTPWVLGWGVALCGLVVLAVPSALDKTLATNQTLVLVASFLLACALVVACETFNDIRLLTAIFLAAGCVMCAEGFSSTTTTTNFRAVVSTRAVGVFQSPNELGTLAAILLMVALGVVLSGLPRGYRLLGAVAVVSAISALALSLSRGAWLGAGAGIVGLAIFIPWAWRVLVAVALVGLILGLALGAFNANPTEVQVLRSRFSEILHPVSDPYDQRPAIWAEAEREIALRPLFGYGPGNFPVASARSGSAAQSIAAVHAHDVLLTVAAEAGLPAAAAVVAFTLGIAWAAWRTRRALRGKPDAAMAAGFAAALLAVLVHGTVDFTLRNSTLMGLVWVMAALVVACERIARTPSLASGA
jgi:putative inorganic carbon (hco3(-)) transporter